jgi:hypothetical protein
MRPLHAPKGMPFDACSVETLKRKRKTKAHECGHSLWELCEGNLEGGLPCWGPWRIGRKGPGDGHVSVGTLLWNLEGCCSTGDFERWM